MSKKHYLHLFPVPNALSMPVFGLDVSDRSIKVVNLERHGNKINLDLFGEKIIPEGIIELGEIKKKNELSKIVKEVKDSYKIKYINTSLPEEQSYVLQLRLPKIEESQIRSSIELQLEEHIPLPATEVVFDYEIISESDKDGSLGVNIHILPKKIVNEYLDLFNEVGIQPASLEIEASAFSRSLIPKNDDDTYMIIDFGSSRTTFSIISRNKVWFTSGINLGGADLTKIISKEYKLSFEEAEKLKIDLGLSRQDQKSIYPALVQTLSVLRDEIKKHYTYWNLKRVDEGKKSDKIEKIILCGGSSCMNGLAGFLTTDIGAKVSLSNPWINILSIEENIPELSYNESIRYAQAIGLALRKFEND